MTEHVLPGGVGNAGQVVRVGDTVRRPWHPTTPTIHGLLAHLAEAAPGVAPEPLEGWPAPADGVWSDELADPHGGPLVVHCDVCPENVIARDGLAVAVVDWEFAAPGRRVWDVVSTARLCVPYVAPSRRDPAYSGLDVDARLSVFLDAYDLAENDRAVFADVVRERRAVGERFVRARVARGEPAFVERWADAAGERLLDEERAWVSRL